MHGRAEPGALRGRARPQGGRGGRQRFRRKARAHGVAHVSGDSLCPKRFRVLVAAASTRGRSHLTLFRLVRPLLSQQEMR